MSLWAPRRPRGQVWSALSSRPNYGSGQASTHRGESCSCWCRLPKKERSVHWECSSAGHEEESSEGWPRRRVSVGQPAHLDAGRGERVVCWEGDDAPVLSAVIQAEGRAGSAPRCPSFATALQSEDQAQLTRDRAYRGAHEECSATRECCSHCTRSDELDEGDRRRSEREPSSLWSCPDEGGW